MLDGTSREEAANIGGVDRQTLRGRVIPWRGARASDVSGTLKTLPAALKHGGYSTTALLPREEPAKFRNCTRGWSTSLPNLETRLDKNGVMFGMPSPFAHEPEPDEAASFSAAIRLVPAAYSSGGKDIQERKWSCRAITPTWQAR